MGMIIIPNMMVRSTPNKISFIRVDGPSAQQQGILLSGISFFLITVISLGISFAIVYLLKFEAPLVMQESQAIALVQLFVGSSLLFLIGLKDDLSEAADFAKFGALLLASLLLPGVGIWIDDLHGLFGIHAISPFLGIPLTVLLVMYVTFAFSLLDGIDGLCAGFGFLILLSFFIFGACCSSVAYGFATGAALGVAVVLCVMNLAHRGPHPSMMGNSGAYVLGYIVACLTVGFCRVTIDGFEPMTLCYGIMVLPMLDVLRVLGSRIRDGRNIESPDRNQFNYKLVRTGLRPSSVPLLTALFMCLLLAFNVVGNLLSWNVTVLLLATTVLWVTLEYLLNWRIHAFEQAHHRAEWNKLYGKAAWDSHVPHEVMRHKVETYGTMGLPPHMQSENPIEFIPDGMTGFGRSTKRLWDLTLSACCLLAFSPLFLLCYLLIKMDDGCPVIYRQERIGRFGRPFYIYKFRSMRTDAEKDGPALSHASGDEDPRLTKVGRFLRRHHLDELPQLWNVFVGDMAFIGYRPERKFFIDQIMREDPRYAFLYQIRPGVTSYATLYNGYTDTMAKMLRRLELDLYYLRHRSWWFDIKVLFLTFTSIVFGKKF